MPSVKRALPIFALTASCGVVVVDTHDAGHESDALPAADSGEPIDSGVPEDASPSDTGLFDAGSVDSGVTHTLTINVIGPGRVTSTPTGIACPGVCDAPFLYSAPFELHAEPDPNARLVGWTIPCADADATCSVALTRDLTINVEFETRPPIVTTGQAADLVLGQPDFVTTTPNAIASTTLTNPIQCSTFGSRLWIADAGNNRLLQWDSEPFLNQSAATEAIGQPNLISDGTLVDAESTHYVGDAASDGQRLFVIGDNRILVFDPIPNSTGRAAALVFGQPDFTSSDLGPPSASQFSSTAISVSAGRIFVADTQYHRILIWNSIPNTSGLHPADVVLGQPDFTTTNAPTPPTAATLRYPRDVFHDPETGKLAVVDNGNHRVLIWNSVPTANGTAADIVVGQSDFVGRLPNAGGPGPNEFGVQDARAVTIAHDAMFVADFGNQRVLVWQPVPISSTEPASFVLGRGSFTETGNPDPSAMSVGYAHGVCVLKESLYVLTLNWHRATRFALTP